VRERHRAPHDLGDQLDEADLGDHVLAHDVIDLAMRLGIVEHEGHGVGEILDVAELAKPAAMPGHQHRAAAPDPVHEERLVVARVERAHDMGRPHDGDGPPVASMAFQERVLARDLVARVVAPVGSPRRLLRVRDGQGMIVDAARRDEDHMGTALERVEQRGDVLAHGRRVGHVEHAVEALAPETLAEPRVVLAVARDGADAGGEPLLSPAAIEDRDLVAAPEQRLEQVQADELGPAHDEGAHDGGILAHAGATVSRWRRQHRSSCA
jgi:hypothetical protein